MTELRPQWKDEQEQLHSVIWMLMSYIIKNGLFRDFMMLLEVETKIIQDIQKRDAVGVTSNVYS